MNKLIITSATALILGVAALSSAQAQTQMNQQPSYNAAPQGANGWTQSNTSQRVYEGRNVYAPQNPASQGVEPYIANQIEQNARSSR